MAETGGALELPRYRDILNLNRRHIETTGGEWVAPDNVRNAGSLRWVLEAIQHPLFGSQRYPTLAEKAALLAWIIIDGHVFFDGCKRTGMAALEMVLWRNGYELQASGDQIIEIALRIARRAEEPFSLDELIAWVRASIRRWPGS